MYQLDKIKKIEYFKTHSEEYLFDSLTNVLSRKSILGLINYYISKNKPFYLLMLDIDNFKLVNDFFGHKAGDEVLSNVASDIVSYFEKYGIVGRYGGDEFLVVIDEPSMLNYQSLWSYLREYILRVKRTSFIDYSEMRITITLGAVAYPTNATNFETLFNKADKAMYRGKQKGRNCFIIYVEAKHKDIDVNLVHNELQFSGLMTYTYDLITNEKKSLEKRIADAMISISNFFSISGAAFVSSEKEIVTKNLDRYLTFEWIDSIKNEIKNDQMLMVNDFNFSIKQHQDFCNHCKEVDVKSFVILKVYNHDELFGYLTFYDDVRKRIWQTENALLFKYMANILALVLKK